jgi:hypothetical protein
MVVFAQVPENINYQAVLRNNNGELVKNQNVTIQVSIIDVSSTGTVIYQEQHSKTTDNFGQVNLAIGNGVADFGTFATINWGVSEKFLKIEVNTGTGFVNMGTTQFVSVPYALFAKNVENKDDADANPENEIQDLNLSGNTLTITNKTNPTAIDLAPFSGTNTDNQTLSLTDTDLSISGGNTVDLSPIQDGVNDADADPTNEIQNLILTGDTLKISDGNQVVFPYDSSNWAINGNKLYYNTGNVGIGTNEPNSKLEVKSSATGALFQVINANNDTVFAVYPDGVKVFVDASAKGSLGGFAVSGRTSTKAGENVEYFRVTPDSTRIYINEDSTKGSLGGFAVSGRTSMKGTINDYLFVTGDSTRIYINEDSTKGNLGGFAVSGRTSAKGSSYNYLQVLSDSTRIFVKDSVAGFGIANLESGTSESFLNLNKQNYFIGHQTGGKVTEGIYNSMLGYQAGFNTSSGSNNLFLGYRSGYMNNSGGNNVFIGTESGYVNQSTFQNTYVGYRSGYELSGAANTALGSMAGENASGGNNTFIGSSAGRLATGGNNTFLGQGAGYGFPDINMGVRNTYIGQAVGAKTNTGSYNVMLGFNSGYLNYEGSRNTFLGYDTGHNIHEGSGNIFIGYEAGKNIDGISNRLVIENSSADSTTALIYGEFDQDDLRINANVGIYAAPNSSYGLFIDRGGITGTYGTRSIGNAIGVYGWAGGSGSSATRYGIYGYASGGTTNYAGYFSGDVNVTGTFTNPSDKKLKKNIKPVDGALNKVLNLQGVTFEWKSESELSEIIKNPELENEEISDRFCFPKGSQIGLIAQDLEKVLPELVKTDADGLKSVDYIKIVPVLIEAIKDQQKIIDEQKSEIIKLNDRLLGIEKLLINK